MGIKIGEGFIHILLHTEQGRKLFLSLAAMAKDGSALILSDIFDENTWFEKGLNVYCEFKSWSQTSFRSNLQKCLTSEKEKMTKLK